MCKTCTREPIKGHTWQRSYSNEFNSAKLTSIRLWVQQQQKHSTATSTCAEEESDQQQHQFTRGHPRPQGGSGQDTGTVAHHEITEGTVLVHEPELVHNGQSQTTLQELALDNQSQTTLKELAYNDQSPTTPHAEKLTTFWARGHGERLEDHWRRLPLFFLGGDEPEDKDQEEELKLLNNPDLYPVPKNHNYKTDSPESLPNLATPGIILTDSPESLPNLATPGIATNLSFSSAQSTPLSPRSPKKNQNTEDQTNIKERIQSCLHRARNRRSSISSQSGVYSRSISVSSLRGLDTRPAEHDAAVYMTTRLCDASTITELCTAENIPEVEIISLVQEQFPQYKLRAETITNFSSYDNSDWGVTFPALKEEEVEALSPEQAEGALAYFVLCGNRVSQMTKTYNDIEAVTRLLQEKEKDLELAAKIGQQLLSRSKVLEERNAGLELELASSGDIITQLKHDLQMKTDLLQIYTNDVDDSSCETTPTGLRFINVDILQNRVKNLESENEILRDEASKLVDETDEVEDREENLVKDVIKQLGDANSHANQLSDELSKKVEDSLRQQEEITHLLAQVVDLQSRNKRMNHENEELHNMVGVARECQQELTTELAELKEKYAEVLDLLHDTQEQLRRVQKKNLPGSRGSHLSNSIYSSPFNSGNDSIATELHSLNSIGEELSNTDEAVQNHNLRRAFETVRLTGKYSSGSHGSLSSLGYGSSVISTPTRVPSVMGTPTHMTNSMSQSYNSNYLGSRGSSIYSGESGHPSLDSGADSDASMHTDSEDNYPASQAGVPGWPGTPDLNSCLRRLGPGERSMTPSHYLPYGCRTPDSIMSTDPKNLWPISPVLSPGSTKSGGSISSGFAGSGSDQWRLPQKLQIVKPIEGSLTLHQWSRLAKPHLGGLLEEREGVANKGGIGHNLNLEVYSMSDLEEDEEIIPGKQFMSTSGINTYTNSTILHPDDNTLITPSLSKTQVSVLPTCSGLTGTTPSTPLRQPSCPASRRGSTATFSTNVGLAKVLNERGMTQGHGWSPTATPANSPSGSRPGSPEPEGYKLPGLDDLTKTFQYGASLLRRTFYKEEVSSGPHSPVGPRVNLLETVQDIGVARLMRPQEMTLSVGGVVTSRPATSPLLHLSNLIMSSAAAKNTSTTISTTTCATTSITYSGITSTTNVRAAGGLMFTPKLTSPGERRPSFPPGAPMGIPGHPGAGHLDTRLSQLKPGQRIDFGTVRLGQRNDLGTVGGRQRPTSLGTVPGRGRGADNNVGAVGWMAQGRKGGLY